jgi:undecaprenyl-diphosphatase
MEFEALNLALFRVINAPLDVAAPTLLFAKVAAKYFIDASFGAVVLKGLVGDGKDQRAVALVLLAVLLSLFLNYLVALTFPHPRPFMVGVGHTFVSHRAEGGFPSDHATPMWTIAFGLLLWLPRSSVGWLTLALAAETSWARVFVGVHFPFDILGSMAVAGVSVAALAAARPLIEQAIARPIEAWPRRVEKGRLGNFLRQLRLRPAVAPSSVARSGSTAAQRSSKP